MWPVLAPSEGEEEPKNYSGGSSFFGGGWGGETERGRKKNRWLDGDQARTGHVTGGVPWNFLLALPFCRSSWCHYSRRLREFEAPAEQIGQSARIIRRKLLLISHRLPRPHSHTLSLFLSFLRADFSSKLCRGRAEDLENMSSWALFQTMISTIRGGKKKKRDTYSLSNNAMEFLTILKEYYTLKFTTCTYCMWIYWEHGDICANLRFLQDIFLCAIQLLNA